MSGRVRLLATLFGLQLLLVAGFFYLNASGSDQAPPGFLDFVVDDVDRLVVSGEGAEVELRNGGDGWRLSEGAPADTDKITEVLDKLGSLSAPWPVATSESSRERFEVTTDSNQRHIQMWSGEKTVADMYLGTSPGYRRVHARAAGADEVYSIDFSAFEVPVEQDDWLDKDLLQAAGDVTEVTRVGAWALRKSEEGWLLSAAPPAQNAGENGPADPHAAAKVVDRMSDLRVTGFAADDANLTEAGTFSVVDDAGSHRLQLFHDEAEDGYVIESDRFAGRFAVAAYIAEQLIVTEEDLRPATPEGPEFDAAEPSG